MLQIWRVIPELVQDESKAEGNETGPGAEAVHRVVLRLLLAQLVDLRADADSRHPAVRMSPLRDPLRQIWKSSK